MEQYDQLTLDQQQDIDTAVQLVTIDVLESLKHGEEKEIFPNVVLYKYTEDDIVVMNIKDEWIEIYQFLWGREQDEIQIESL